MSVIAPPVEFAVYEVVPGGEIRLAEFVLESDARRFARSMQRGRGAAAGFRYYVAPVREKGSSDD